MKNKLHIGICKNFGMEAAAVVRKYYSDDVRLKLFPSRCHRPDRMAWELSKAFSGSATGDACWCVLGGACLRGERVGGKGKDQPRFEMFDQCFHIVAPRELVDDLIKAGAYVVTPCWLLRWRQRIGEWGFDRDTARPFFKESCERLVLLDTGVSARSLTLLKDFAQFVDRPHERVVVGLDVLRLHVERLVRERQLEACRDRLREAERQSADFAMAHELTARIAEIRTEREAVDDVLSLFKMLFAPRSLSYLPVVGTHREHSHAPHCHDGELGDFLEDFRNDYKMMESMDGFLVKVRHDNEILGLVKVDGVLFPQYLARYVNLAVDVGRICGLAIANARAFEVIKQTEEHLRHEIKERQRAEEVSRKMGRELLKFQKMEAMSVLVGGVAHDFNNMLGVIMGNVDMAQCGMDSKTPPFHFLNEARTGCQRVAELVRKLLMVTDSSRPLRQQVSVEALLHNAVHMVFNGSAPDVMLPSSERLWQVAVDPVHVQQAIRNVLENAREAMPVDGVVEISAGNLVLLPEERRERGLVVEPGRYVKLTIKDSGPGIQCEFLDKIFDPYFSTKPRGTQKGMGMGLTFAYLAIRKQGGAMEVASGAGVGTAVDIYLPASEDET